MSIIASILRAIGIRVAPPVYLNSRISLGDIMLNSKIETINVLDSEIDSTKVNPDTLPD